MDMDMNITMILPKLETISWHVKYFTELRFELIHGNNTYFHGD